MDHKENYLTLYRKFFEDVVASIDPSDQLPVKVGGYNISQHEIDGVVVDWTMQYLCQKECPVPLQALLTQSVLKEVQQFCKKEPASCGYNTTDNVYLPLKLVQSVTSISNELCRRYLDNSLLDALPSPSAAELETPRYACASTKNTRRKMEDRFVALADFHVTFGITNSDEQTTSFYCVFDGHAGHEAAVYAAAHLPQHLAESALYGTDPEKALREAFLLTDSAFAKKCEEEGFKSGTTVVAALIRPGYLTVAWVGDSQALLAKNGRVMQIVIPHKPSREDERKRIEDLGGFVVQYGIPRVNGQLAVSRAIGDTYHKPYVTADPDITTISLDGDEDYLILASDGLWDFVTEDHAATFVYDFVKENAEDPNISKQISQGLVSLAKDHGSTDNITVVLILLKPWKLISASSTKLEQQTEEKMDLFTENRSQMPLEKDNRNYLNMQNSESLDGDVGPETNIDCVDDNVEVTVIERSSSRVHSEDEEVENVGDADSEDEWNYYKGYQSELLDQPSENTLLIAQSYEQMMASQLNPDAAEFVPILPSSPQIVTSIPFKENLLDDIMAQSPRKADDFDLKLPSSHVEFANEVQLRPGGTSPCNESFEDLININEKESQLLSDMESLGNGHVISPTSLIVGNEDSSTGNFSPPDLMTASFYQENVNTSPFQMNNDINEDPNIVQQLPLSDSDDECQDFKENAGYNNLVIEKEVSDSDKECQDSKENSGHKSLIIIEKELLDSDEKCQDSKENVLHKNLIIEKELLVSEEKCQDSKENTMDKSLVIEKELLDSDEKCQDSKENAVHESLVIEKDSVCPVDEWQASERIDFDNSCEQTDLDCEFKINYSTDSGHNTHLSHEEVKNKSESDFCENDPLMTTCDTQNQFVQDELAHNDGALINSPDLNSFLSPVAIVPADPDDLDENVCAAPVFDSQKHVLDEPNVLSVQSSPCLTLSSEIESNVVCETVVDSDLAKDSGPAIVCESAQGISSEPECALTIPTAPLEPLVCDISETLCELKITGNENNMTMESIIPLSEPTGNINFSTESNVNIENEPIVQLVREKSETLNQEPIEKNENIEVPLCEPTEVVKKKTVSIDKTSTSKVSEKPKVSIVKRTTKTATAAVGTKSKPTASTNTKTTVTSTSTKTTVASTIAKTTAASKLSTARTTSKPKAGLKAPLSSSTGSATKPETAAIKAKISASDSTANKATTSTASSRQRPISASSALSADKKLPLKAPPKDKSTVPIKRTTPNVTPGGTAKSSVASTKTSTLSTRVQVKSATNSEKLLKDAKNQSTANNDASLKREGVSKPSTEKAKLGAKPTPRPTTASQRAKTSSKDAPKGTNKEMSNISNKPSLKTSNISVKSISTKVAPKDASKVGQGSEHSSDTNQNGDAPINK